MTRTTKQKQKQQQRIKLLHNNSGTNNGDNANGGSTSLIRYCRNTYNSNSNKSNKNNNNDNNIRILRNNRHVVMTSTSILLPLARKSITTRKATSGTIIKETATKQVDEVLVIVMGLVAVKEKGDDDLEEVLGEAAIVKEKNDKVTEQAVEEEYEEEHEHGQIEEHEEVEEDTKNEIDNNEVFEQDMNHSLTLLSDNNTIVKNNNNNNMVINNKKTEKMIIKKNKKKNNTIKNHNNNNHSSIILRSHRNVIKKLSLVSSQRKKGISKKTTIKAITTTNNVSSASPYKQLEQKKKKKMKMIEVGDGTDNVLLLDDLLFVEVEVETDKEVLEEIIDVKENEKNNNSNNQISKQQQVVVEEKMNNHIEEVGVVAVIEEIVVIVEKEKDNKEIVEDVLYMIDDNENNVFGNNNNKIMNNKIHNSCSSSSSSSIDHMNANNNNSNISNNIDTGIVDNNDDHLDKEIGQQEVNSHVVVRHDNNNDNNREIIIKHNVRNDIDNDNNDTTDHQCHTDEIDIISETKYRLLMNDYHHREEVERGIEKEVIVEEEVEVGDNNNNISSSSNHVRMMNSNKKRRLIRNYDDDDSIYRHKEHHQHHLDDVDNDDGWASDDGDDDKVINLCDDDDAGRYKADDDNNIMNAINDDNAINRRCTGGGGGGYEVDDDNDDNMKDHDDENDDNNDYIDLSINNNDHCRRHNHRIQQQFDKIINAACGIVGIDDDDDNHCDGQRHSRSIHQQSKVHVVVTPNTSTTTTIIHESGGSSNTTATNALAAPATDSTEKTNMTTKTKAIATIAERKRHDHIIQTINNQCPTTLLQQQHKSSPPRRRIPIMLRKDTMMKDYNSNDYINSTAVVEPTIVISPFAEKNDDNNNNNMSAKKDIMYFDHHDDDHDNRQRYTDPIITRECNTYIPFLEKTGYDSINNNDDDNINKNKDIHTIKKVDWKNCEKHQVDLVWNNGDEDDDNDEDDDDDVDNIIDDNGSLEIISASERRQRLMTIKEAIRKRVESKQKLKPIRFKSTSASLIGSVNNKNNKKMKRMMNRYYNINIKVSPIQKQQQQTKPSLLSSIRKYTAIQRRQLKPYRHITSTTTTTTTTTTSTFTPMAADIITPGMITTTTTTTTAKSKTKKRVYNYHQQIEIINVEKKTNHHQSNPKHESLQQNQQQQQQQYHQQSKKSPSKLQISSSLPSQIMKKSKRNQDPIISEQNEFNNYYDDDSDDDRKMPTEVSIGILSSSLPQQQQKEKGKRPPLRSNSRRRRYISDDIDKIYCLDKYNVKRDARFHQIWASDHNDDGDDDDQHGDDITRHVLKRLKKKKKKKKKTEKAKPMEKQVQENVRNVKHNEWNDNDNDRKISAISKNTGSRTDDKIQSLMLRQSINKDNNRQTKVNSDKVVNNSSQESSGMHTSLCNDEIFFEQASRDLVDVNGIKFFADHSLIVSSFGITCKPSLMALESNLHSSIKNKANTVVTASLSSSCNRLHQQSTVAGCVMTAEVSMKNLNHTQINKDDTEKCASNLIEQNATHNDSNPNGGRCSGNITNNVGLLTPLDNEINPDSDDIWTNVLKPVLQHLSSPEGSLALSTIWDREFPLAIKDNDHPCSLPPKWNDVFGDWTDRFVFDTKDDIEKSRLLFQKSHTSIILGENDVHWWTNDTSSMMMYHMHQEEQEKMAHRQKNFVVDEKEMTSRVDDNISVSSNDTSNTVTAEDRLTCEKDIDLKLLLDSHLIRMPSPRHLTKLRRILLPMIMQVVIVKESKKKKKKKNSNANIKSNYSRCCNNDGFNLKAVEDFDQCRAKVTGGRRVRKAGDRVCVGLYPLNKSIAEFWLDCRETRDKILHILLRLSTKIPYCDEGIIEDPFMKYHAMNFSTQSRYQYQEIQNLILQLLRKANMKYRYCGIELQLNDKLRYSDIPKDASQQRIYDDYQAFFLKHQNYEDNRFEMKRQDMIARYYNIADENVPKEKLLQGYVLRTEEEDGMTEEQFLKETYSMNKLNESFPRHFIPLVSRPRFAQIPKSDDIDIHLRRLHFSLFNADGSLKESVFNDVSKSDKHYFITFSNSNGGGKDDHRWQIPFLCHTKKAKCRTREVIEKIVAKMNLINPEKEHLQDLGILIGGTLDQSLHHDISRQWTIWEHHRNERKRSTTTKQKQNESDDDNEQQIDESATVGWEANRLVYNFAMADPYAPSSFLIGLNMSSKSAIKDSRAMPSTVSSQSASRFIYIGVQKDQIDRISQDKCRIKDGMPHEEYHIVRESDDVVVLEVEGGCYFTGDFQHAGVRNVVDGTDDAKLMDRLFRSVQRIVNKYDKKEYMKQNQDKVGKLRSKEVLRLFSNFSGLDRLCRLHFSTKLNDSKMIVPKNAIGFHNCIANGE